MARGLLSRACMLDKTLSLFAVTLLACQSAPPVPSSSTPPAPARDPRLAVLDRMTAAIHAKDAHALAALYADDAVIEVAGGRPLHGRAEIEAEIAAMLQPAEAIKVAIARVWLTDDVAIVENVFRAHHGVASPLYDIGESELSILWFDRDGRIAKEHSYRDQPTLEAQAAGEPDAAELPVLPEEPELHIASGPTDAATLSWVRDVEAKWDTEDVDGATHSDDLQLDCMSGHAHLSSRAEAVAALKHWRTAFPNQTNRPSNIWRVGDYVILEDVFSGVQHGDLGSIKATDRPVAWHWAHVWKLASGKITRAWQWSNFDELYRQIGAPPRKDGAKQVRPACSIRA